MKLLDKKKEPEGKEGKAKAKPDDTGKASKPKPAPEAKKQAAPTANQLSFGEQARSGVDLIGSILVVVLAVAIGYYIYTNQPNVASGALGNIAHTPGCMNRVSTGCVQVGGVGIKSATEMIIVTTIITNGVQGSVFLLPDAEKTMVVRTTGKALLTYNESGELVSLRKSVRISRDDYPNGLTLYFSSGSVTVQ